MNEIAIPYLEKEAIIAVINRENQYNKKRPISQLFARMGHDAEKVEVRIRTRLSGSVKHTTMDGEGVPVRSGTFITRQYSPAWMKVFATLNSKEIALFRKADEAKQSRDTSPQGIAFQALANELILDLGKALEADLGTERERLCVGALTGTVSGVLTDGNTESINYNLTALTAPSTKWDNAAATIVTNLYGAIDEYKTNNPRGLAPNVAFYHPSLYKNAFVGNTEWVAFKKANPDLAAGFLRLAGARTEATAEGYFTDPLFGLQWVPIDGTYKDASGTTQNYWSYKDITLARTEEAGLEWGMTFGHEYNPSPAINVAVEGPDRPDVQTWKVHAFDNGLPVVKEPEMLQTWRVIT